MIYIFVVHWIQDKHVLNQVMDIKIFSKYSQVLSWQNLPKMLSHTE